MGTLMLVSSLHANQQAFESRVSAMEASIAAVIAKIGS